MKLNYNLHSNHRSLLTIHRTKTRSTYVDEYEGIIPQRKNTGKAQHKGTKKRPPALKGLKETGSTYFYDRAGQQEEQNRRRFAHN